MAESSFDKGLESLVAELIRTHLVDSVFAKDAVRKGLTPEKLESLRQEILTRLKEAEESGLEHRDAVRKVMETISGFIPKDSLMSTVAKSFVDKIVPPAASQDKEEK
ncbi:MAG TPA: hypothetical protein PLA59_10200 [Myxococcota bacterium]|nr:hypothetical protein [Myxococcota bacterium]